MEGIIEQRRQKRFYSTVILSNDPHSGFNEIRGGFCNLLPFLKVGYVTKIQKYFNSVGAALSNSFSYI
jgi:hypothetical protein